jgi:hypothetical protein
VRPAALLLLACLAQPALATAQGGILEVRTGLDRSRPWLHQQVVLEVVVTHRLYARPRWQPPVCEGFWVERMPSEGGSLLHPGGRESARTTVFRRALFPTRVGVLEIPASSLLVKTRDDEEVEVGVPGTRVEVRALPDAGRPEGFSGLVGPLEVRLAVDDDEVALGRGIRVEVDVYGAGNVWDVKPPDLAARIGREVEVFAERARTLTNTRKGRMMARRIFRFDIVSRESGRHTIAPIEIPYFDPVRGRYATAASEPVEFVVAARGELSRRAPWEVRQRAGEVVLNRGLLLPALMIVVGLLALCAWALSRWWRGEQRAWQREPEPDPDVLLRRAERALGSDEFLALLAAAVKAGIRARHAFDPSAMTTSELAQRIDDGEALRILRAVDAARFARDESDATELLVSTRRYLDC